MSDDGGFLMGLVLGLAAGVIACLSFPNTPKNECEANLPRNVECVWAAPVEGGE